MKHLLFALLTSALVFSSCTTEEVINDTKTNSNKMLESFVVSRNADGSYALTHEVTEGVGTAYYDTKNTKEIHLFDGETSEKTLNTKSYEVINNKLDIAFVDDSASTLPSLSITDDDTSATESRENSLLDTYSVAYNTDGTIQLNFNVKRGVEVEFGYNSENVNDVYLSRDINATQINYSKKYVKSSGMPLRIDFVQQGTNKNPDQKKPVMVVDDGY